MTTTGEDTIMSDLKNHTDVIKLATGHHDDRSHLDRDDIRPLIKAKLNSAIEKLEIIFDLTLLEGAIVCDDFHNTKKDLVKCGEDYGYITSFVERTGKSNAFRFQYRRPTPSGSIIRKNIKLHKSKGGYVASSFKLAGHELEKKLCIMTEDYYFPLRTQSKSLREVIRKLRKLESNIKICD